MTARNATRANPGSRRQTAPLGAGLEKSLSAYASTAVAAGVGLLAMARPSEAEVVYTPANVDIELNQGAVLVDLNHDGIADFAFWNFRFSSSLFDFAVDFNLYVGCAPVGSTCQNQGNEIWGRGVGSQYGRFASALPVGFRVGANKSYFQQSPKRKYGSVSSPVAQMAGLGLSYSDRNLAFSSTHGQWLYTQDRFLGLRFMISGQVHYGWARVAVTREKGGFAATLTGYAYETIPNKPIFSGQTDAPTLAPAALGRLAQGASGISAWREKK